MDRITLSLLRGICQLPADITHESGFFEQNGIQADLKIEPRRWLDERQPPSN